MKVEPLLNNPPSTVPTNKRNIIFPLPFLKITLKRITENTTIRLPDIKKLAVLLVIIIELDPNANTTNVWISPYKESSPIILGVIILLFVTVWNSIDDTAIDPPAINIPITFGILFWRL